MEAPICSIIIVNFNGKKFLDSCLRSFEQLHYPPDRLEILLVDNGSDDGSDSDALVCHPRVQLLRNPVNNFPAALNLGVAESKGSYVAFANNDVFVDRGWLGELVRVFEENPRGGSAGGKILFENGRINSVGHRALPDFYWEDEGYNQEDRGQYDFEREVESLCWAAVLFRRACLDDIGPIDEDYILYYEDVDTALRCRQRGWKFLYSPRAIARHVFHGSSLGTQLTDYFCDRARLVYVAKHHPEKLPAAVKTSRFLNRLEWESLYDCMPIVIKKLIERHPERVTKPVLEELCDALESIFGDLAVDHLLARMQVILGYRKMSIGFYDQAMHVIGGGQKYGCTMAAALQDKFEVTLLASKPVNLIDLERWYELGLSQCRLKIIPMSFFDGRGTWIDSNAVPPDVPNPFEVVAVESQSFDIFVNVNQLTMVRPLSPFSIFLCHFPDTLRRCYFWVQDYSCLVANSAYTAHWVKALWGLEPHLLLYPPVDMSGVPEQKENLILSVARFEPGGSKKQHELIRAFGQLYSSNTELLRGWRLVLVGGSLPENRYLEEIRRLAKKSEAPIEIRVNVPASELQSLYTRAKIFWHACGLGEIDPHLIEHFGMTTVEAMQNRCVPIVINGGGQREIVEHGRSGYRFDTLADLCRYTLAVIADQELMEQLQKAAFGAAQSFSRKRFEEFVRQFFQDLQEDYCRIPVPDARDILRNRQRPQLFYSPLARRAFLNASISRSLRRGPGPGSSLR